MGVGPGEELVALVDGRPSFAGLTERMHVTNARRAALFLRDEERFPRAARQMAGVFDLGVSFTGQAHMLASDETLRRTLRRRPVPVGPFLCR